MNLTVEPYLKKLNDWRLNQHLILQQYVGAWLEGYDNLPFDLDDGDTFPKKILKDGKTVGQFRLVLGNYALDWIRSLDDLIAMERAVDALKETD